ncbi:MAG: DUF3955 domain-containing protein [Candidatus Zixiibacteriota bacterium]|nr:MAG: DUF3955 domain-containing protein [candidate division Zixibacteria bacterium]
MAVSRSSALVTRPTPTQTFECSRTLQTAETAFYGNIDANGVLQESFFLPLTFTFVVLGIVLI